MYYNIRVIKIRRMRWARHITRTREMRNTYKVWVKNLKLRDHSEDVRIYCKWEDNIRMGLTEIVWKGVGWINLAEDKGQWWAVVNTIVTLQTA
jgi:hypothetical protein